MKKVENGWVKVYEVEGVSLRGRSKKTLREVVEKHCWTQQLKKKNAMHHSNCRNFSNTHTVGE